MQDITAKDVRVQEFKGKSYWSVRHDANSDVLYDANGNLVGLLLNRQGRLSLHKDQPIGFESQKIPAGLLQELGMLV